LNPLARAILVDWKSQRTKRAALHPHAPDGDILGISGDAPGQQSKLSLIICTR
jgi:hypothetical protein